MEKQINNVQKFNKAFGIVTNNKPSLLSEQEFVLRYKLMMEELGEYRLACVQGDMLEVCDAIVDLYYVLTGMVVAHGLQDVVEDMFDEVHRSNMSKLENGKALYRHDGKVMKGSEYFKPNLIQYLDAKL